MKRDSSTSVFIFAVLALCGGCEANLHGTNNSSQGDNDYFEEPISDRSSQYSAALETSNKFVDYFSKGQLANARSLLDSRLQGVLSEQNFGLFYEKISETYGPFVEYKPMQWGFSTTSRVPNVVVSIKIVIHEGKETFYFLSFEDDGVYDRIINIDIGPRADGERVALAANRAHDRNKTALRN